MCDASILKGLLIFMSFAYERRTPVVAVVAVVAVAAAVTSCRWDAGFRCRACLFL